MKNKSIVFLGVVFVLLGSLAESHANESSVEIEAPQAAEKNSEIVIKIHVFHKGNNLIHHTNWVDIKIDGKPYKRWKFSVLKRPDAENFTREVTYKVTEPITIVAEANCNIHGSEGPKTWTVTLAPEGNEP